jgi:hypothetical protein
MKKAVIIFLVLALITLPISPKVESEKLSLNDEAFLEKIQKDVFRYFWEQANPDNGLIKDSSRAGAPASIAATGFGLTAICIAESRGWISREKAYERILVTLETFRDDLETVHGFYYHFLDLRNGRRVWSCEVSTIDTALFLAGALFAGEYFKGTKVEKIAHQLYERVDWQWASKGGGFISMGYKPETGLFPYFWSSYNELMILYALAIGSPSSPIPAHMWRIWGKPQGEYKGHKLIYCSTGSLFVYQYAHCWIDFKKLDDEGVNWFENSRQATLANRQFCIDNMDKCKTYGPNTWGLSASTGPGGYKGYGAKPGNPIHDGTICPSVAGASIVFTPEFSIKALRYMYEEYGNRIYNKYAFKDAFNIDKNWYSNEHLGISQGPLIIMIENYRTHMVWDTFMKIDCIQNWIEKTPELTLKAKYVEQTDTERVLF